MEGGFSGWVEGLKEREKRAGERGELSGHPE